MQININQLSYTYNQGSPFEHQALHNISLHIPDNRIIALVGTSGSGKSTLVQNMNGLLIPSSGSIELNGQTITSDRRKQAQLFHSIGIIFQFPEHQLFESTVLKDIAFGPSRMELSHDEAQERAIEAMKLVGLNDDLADRSPFHLSGGEKRKAAIAGVIAMEPSFLIMDEPVAGLDKTGKENVFQLMKNWQKEKGRSIVFITHQMDDVCELADDVIVMSEGQAVLQTDPLSLFTDHRATVEELGLGVPKSIEYIDAIQSQLGQSIQPDSLRLLDVAKMLYELQQRRGED